MIRITFYDITTPFTFIQFILEAKHLLFEALNMNDTSILNKSLNYYVIETCPFYPQFFPSS